MTPARRSVGAALLFLACAGLAGVSPTSDGVIYRTFALTEGVFALLLAYLLVLRGAWCAPTDLPGWLALAYGTLASAQALELLFPPPGVVEWIVVTGLAFTAWAALAAGSRTRLMAHLASLALLLALLKFSVIPFVWERAGPAPGEALGFGDVAESFRRLFAEHQPTTPAGQVMAFVALACWALGTRLLWAPAPSSRARAEP